MALWYCDFSTGSDTTGTGTTLLPYKTITKCISVANGGDTINVANTAAQVLTTTIVWAGLGGTTAPSVQNPLIFQAWNNGGSITISTPTGTIVAAEIDGNGAVTSLFSSSSIPAAVSFNGFKMHHTTSYIVSPQDSWRFNNCEFYTGSGSYLVNCTTGGHNVFTNCIFRDDGGSTVDGVFASGSFFYGCYFHGLTGYCIRGGGTTAIPIIVNCVLVSGTKGGILMTTGNHIAINNTIVGNGTASQAGISTITTGRGCIAVNNIITDFSGTSASGILNGSGMNFYMEGNNAYRNNTTNISNQAIFGVDLTANDLALSATPYVSSGTGNYGLITTTPAIGAGYPTGINGSLTIPYNDIGGVQIQYSSGGSAVTAGYAFAT